MSTANTVKEVLVATRWIVNRLGWTQGASYRDVHGRKVGSDEVRSACLTGSLCLVKVDYGSPLLAQTSRFLSKYLPEKHAYNAIVVFNDTPGRTKQDILDLLDKAIERA